MNTISQKIETQISSIEKKISALSGNYLTNTWKRQQEQRHRDNMIDRYKAQKQMLEYLSETACSRDLTLFEKSLLVGSFYESMSSYLNSKKYADEHPGRSFCAAKFPISNEQAAARLRKAGITDTADLLAAIAMYERLMSIATTPPDPAAARIRDLTFQARLYQEGDIQFTPPETANKLIELAGIDSESRVLEPEAGIGSIADEVKKNTPAVDCIEPSGSFRELLRLKKHNLIGSDLFESGQTPVYDAVLMNPPFSDECRHIQYAHGFLKPGGRLAAVCSPRVLQSDQKKYTQFRDWLSGYDHRYDESEAKFEMTGVSTVILRISA